MKIAHTELHDLLLKLFEGQQFPLGDFEDCATTVAWLALHGWPIFDEINDLSQLTQTTSVDITYQANEHLYIDASRNDGLLYGGLAIEAALLHAQKKGAAQLALTNVHYPQLVLPTLCKIGERGYACIAGWQWQAQHWHVAIEAGAAYPTAVSWPILPFQKWKPVSSTCAWPVLKTRSSWSAVVVDYERECI